jgi:hypothetical protein
MKYIFWILLSTVLFWSVFAQITYEWSPLEIYIESFATEHEQRLPELGVWLASVRATTIPNTPEYTLLSSAISDVIDYSKRVKAPAWYAVIPSQFFEVMNDAFAVNWWSQAPIWIIEFADFQCPYCQQQSNNKVLEKIIENNEWIVRTSFGQFPLGWEYHLLAQSAAVAMECVYEQAGLDAAIQFKNTSFATSLQPTLTRMKWYARTISGVDADMFESCVENNETLDAVWLQKQIWIQLGVRWIPYTTIVDTRSGAFITVWWVQTLASLQNHIDVFMSQ